MIDLSTDHSPTAPFGIAVDRGASLPLARQVAEALRSAIRAGRLAGGQRLPSSRDLARELGVSRSVSVAAYEQLEAEGYLEGRVGSGSYVAEGAAGKYNERTPVPEAPPPARLSPGRGAAAEGAAGSGLVDFGLASGCPDLASFPRDEWARCLSLAAREGSAGYGYGDPAGDGALRRAIAAYLFRMKGISCSEDELVVTAGSSQAAVLLATLLGRASREIQVEDPGYPPLRSVFRRNIFASALATSS